MKRIILMFVAVMFTASFAFAQDNCKKGNHEGKCPVAEKIEKMKKDLNLNDKQTKEVKALLEKNHAAMKAKMETAKKSGQKPDPAVMKADMQKEMAATEAAMKKILTAEQFAKFQQMSKQCAKESCGKCKGDASKESCGKCKGDATQAACDNCKKDSKKEPCGKCKTDKK